MTGSVYPEVLREDYGGTHAVIANRIAPAGTFLLRRTQYLNEIEQGLKLSAEQIQALANLIKDGDFEARQKVIVHNLRLVAGIAKRYANRGVELLDLVSAGTMGLIHALEGFDLEGGFRFTAYAARCVREYIERAITNRNNDHPAAASQLAPSLASVA